MFPVSIDRIALLVGAPLANVAANWPLIDAAMTRRGVLGDDVRVVAIATAAVETARHFAPIQEFGGAEYFRLHYDVTGNNPDLARRLGNTSPGDGALYCGRGEIQITGKSNYMNYGQRLGVDLVGNPERALEPALAAEIFALFLADHHEQAAADHHAWEECRRKVNGGKNGLADFLKYVNRLEEEIAGKNPLSTAVAAGFRP